MKCYIRFKIYFYEISYDSWIGLGWPDVFIIGRKLNSTSNLNAPVISKKKM